MKHEKAVKEKGHKPLFWGRTKIKTSFHHVGTHASPDRTASVPLCSQMFFRESFAPIAILCIYDFLGDNWYDKLTPFDEHKSTF